MCLANGLIDIYIPTEEAAYTRMPKGRACANNTAPGERAHTQAGEPKTIPPSERAPAQDCTETLGSLDTVWTVSDKDTVGDRLWCEYTMRLGKFASASCKNTRSTQNNNFI